jgi:formamidopyrimidine-DNA glycosylase
MPELAEVEYYRKQWDPGVGQRVTALKGHFDKRLFRDTDVRNLRRLLPGTRLVESEALGKRMVFRFSRELWLGIHLGMTGRLRVEQANFRPAKHDHLVIYQSARALVFADARQFGRVLFHQGALPESWKAKSPGITSKEFTTRHMGEVLARHRSLPIKAALLSQRGFPGIGNWMADEILWQARLHPLTKARDILAAELRKLWRSVRFVAQTAVATIGQDFADPPAQWLFHQRWKRKGHCPRDGVELSYATVGGRTTVWCPRCQGKK